MCPVVFILLTKSIAEVPGATSFIAENVNYKRFLKSKFEREIFIICPNIKYFNIILWNMLFKLWNKWQEKKYP